MNGASSSAHSSFKIIFPIFTLVEEAKTNKCASNILRLLFRVCNHCNSFVLKVLLESKKYIFI